MSVCGNRGWNWMFFINSGCITTLSPLTATFQTRSLQPSSKHVAAKKIWVPVIFFSFEQFFVGGWNSESLSHQLQFRESVFSSQPSASFALSKRTKPSFPSLFVKTHPQPEAAERGGEVLSRQQQEDQLQRSGSDTNPSLADWDSQHRTLSRRKAPFDLEWQPPRSLYSIWKTGSKPKLETEASSFIFTTFLWNANLKVRKDCEVTV